MNQTYKIIGRSRETGKQKKKRIYVSTKDFLKYKDDLIKRYKYCYGIVEVYKLVKDKWVLMQI